MSEINNIKSLSQSELVASRNTAARDNQKSSNAEVASTSANRSDTVSLTNAAEQIQSLQQVIADLPVADSERVDSLKAAIADGTYSITVPSELTGMDDVDVAIDCDDFYGDQIQDDGNGTSTDMLVPSIYSLPTYNVNTMYDGDIRLRDLYFDVTNL